MLGLLRSIAPVTAVAGNTDDGVGAHLLPAHATLHLLGWKVLVTHIVGPGSPPKGEAPTAVSALRGCSSCSVGPMPGLVSGGHSLVQQICLIQ